ncbi:MAG: CHAT domain-containing protein/tetratricopeptide (TPR) repeat protein [Chlamydiales bacterium]|jgi:CHAT domain-containing protein/tetratricopeptide (TPR) repeat protein
MLGLITFVAVCHLAHPTAVPRSVEAPVEAPVSLTATLTGYLEELGSLRTGDDRVLPALRATGRRLCEHFARCDALDVLEFYAGLTRDQRRQGLADDRALQTIRDFVWELSNDGLPEGESWAVLRSEIRRDLLELISSAAQHADFTPSARAHALLAEVLLASDSGDSARLDEVQGHVDQAIEMFARAGQITPQLEPLWVLGRIHRSRGDMIKAREVFGRCRDLAARLGRNVYRERALLGLVQLAKDVGDWREVDRQLGKIATFRSPRDSWPLAREHATRLVHMDQPEATLRFLLNYPPRAASNDSEWHTMLASAFLRSGDLGAARRELLQLDDASQELRELTGASLELASGAAARVIERLGPLADDASSSDEGFATWSAHGRVQAWSFLGEAALAEGRADEALRWLEMAVQRADEWDAVRSQGGQGSVIGEWLGLHVVVLLARAHAELGDALEAARVIEDFQSRRLRTSALEHSHSNAEARVSRETLLEWSSHFEGGLITWVIGAEYGVVAHVAANGEAWAGTLPRGRRAFQAAVRRLREATILGDDERASQLAHQIATEVLPAELRERLQGSRPGARTLFLLHGALEALPLALMDIDGVRLDERLTALMLPGLAGDPVQHFDPSSAEWTLLGSPVTLDERHDILLPGAAREIADLGRLHPTARSFTGASFTKRATFDALSSAGPVHIATHLVESDSCTGSTMAAVGLELSGGDVLCARDIEALEPRLPLVVLTACDTAGGRFIDGEGMHGISRAFLEAGTANLVSTLWPVEDEAARDFAQRLHTGLVEGWSPARATVAARRGMRADGSPARDWAAFRFMGRD